MTLDVVDPAAECEPEVPAATRERSRTRRRLALHGAALALVLCALLPLASNGTIANSDEGAVLAQARLLEQTGSWSMAGDTTIDPSGRWFGIRLSEQAGDRWYPYAKHPLFVEIVAAVGTERLWVLYLVMIAGTVVASMVAAALAARIDARAAVPALWICGLVSPLLFDSYWLMAHPLGAAAAGVALLAAVAYLDRGRSRWLVVMVVALVASALLRSEGVLYGAAVAAGVLVARAPWSRRIAVSFSAVVGVGGAYVMDARWATALKGGATTEPFRIVDEQGWLEGRLLGAWNSLMRPEVLPTSGAILSLVAASGLIVGAAYLRFRPAERRLAVGALLFGATAAVVRLAFTPSPIGGLLVAFPLLVVGLLFVDRIVLDDTTARVCAAVAAVHALAVLATQYSGAGGGEWGGRFLHLALPAAVALAAVGLVRMRGVVDSEGLTRVVGGCLVVACLSITVLAVHSQAAIRRAPERVVGRIEALVEGTSDPVVMTWPAGGRRAWQIATERTVLDVSDPSELGEVAESACRAGHDRLVVVLDADDAEALARLAPYRFTTGGPAVVAGTRVIVDAVTAAC